MMPHIYEREARHEEMLARHFDREHGKGTQPATAARERAKQGRLYARYFRRFPHSDRSLFVYAASS